MQDFIKNGEWLSFLQREIKLLFNFKVGGLVFLNLFLLLAIGWDTIVADGFKKLDGETTIITQEQDQLEEYQLTIKKIEALKNQLKEIKTKIIRLPKGVSTRLKSVQESRELKKLFELNPDFNYKLLDPETFNSPKPSVSLSAKAAKDLEIVVRKASEISDAETPENTAAAENNETLQINQYDYTYSVIATYGQFLQAMNELVVRDNLLAVREITVEPLSEEEKIGLPVNDALIKITVLVSIYIYQDPTLNG
ncbi:MAG: hypothetical protein AAGI66_06020 [Cyanobacteria bacterium P01_H01_bin.74]